MRGEMQTKEKRMRKFLKKKQRGLPICNDTCSISGRPVGRQGLTFIEMLIAIAIMSILVMTITAVSISYLNSRTAVKKYQANNEELSLALNSLAKDIRMSDFSSEIAKGKQSKISLKNNATEKVVEYTFDSDTKTLSRTEGGGVASVVASDVTGFFYVQGDKIGRITITLVKTGPPIMTAQTTVSMRAKYKDEN